VAQLYPQALGSLLAASYDSQGYNGGIRSRLHTRCEVARFVSHCKQRAVERIHKTKSYKIYSAFVPLRRKTTALEIMCKYCCRMLLCNSNTYYFSFKGVNLFFNYSVLLSLLLYSPSELGLFFSFLILYTVGRTPWTGVQPVAKPLPAHRTTQTQNKRTQISNSAIGIQTNDPSVRAGEDSS
jgi:hypothetical protein